MMNYRVGVFGSLNLGDDEISGNMGMYDQVWSAKINDYRQKDLLSRKGFDVLTQRDYSSRCWRCSGSKGMHGSSVKNII
jgi:hypothetical protein